MYNPVIETKQYRADLDEILQSLKGPDAEHDSSHRYSRERSLATTKIQEAIMWLGMDLKAMKEEGISDLENPYPDSYDTTNDKVAATADGLKF